MRSVAPRLGLLLALLLLCGVVGCKGVNADDLVGTWSMTESSRRYLPTEVGKLAPSLTLSPGGTFTAVEYPRQRMGEAWAAYSGRGTWRMQKAAGAGDVYLRFDDDFGD